MSFPGGILTRTSSHVWHKCQSSDCHHWTTPPLLQWGVSPQPQSKCRLKVSPHFCSSAPHVLLLAGNENWRHVHLQLTHMQSRKPCTPANARFGILNILSRGTFLALLDAPVSPDMLALLPVPKLRNMGGVVSRWPSLIRRPPNVPRECLHCNYLLAYLKSLPCHQHHPNFPPLPFPSKETTLWHVSLRTLNLQPYHLLRSMLLGMLTVLCSPRCPSLHPSLSLYPKASAEHPRRRTSLPPSSLNCPVVSPNQLF